MSSLSSEPPSSEVLLRSGHTSYEFVRWLGPARHGELVLARRHYSERFGGYIVIKRPLPAGDDEARQRLLDEARLTSQLRHPSILSALHMRGSDDAPHLVLEHVPGFRLAALLEASARARHPFSEAFALYVASEVADALSHAHGLSDEHGRQLGVVHRDVTPHNILVSEHGEVKLMDFGAAWSRLSGRVGSEGDALQGSLAYAAPEHVQHTALDGRADQFSLGIVLLQLLTGRHLFEGAERFESRQRNPRTPPASTTQLCARELAWRIRTFSVAELEAATRSVPAALLPLLQRALAPDRLERFDTCAQFARALRHQLVALGEPFGRHEALAELATLRYVSLRVAAGEAPDDAVRERLLPEPGPRSAPRVLASRRSARLRGAPRRR
ncbi:serine/threonine-protein kinase [Hyalangium rubrum]|uniref:Serine/threonine-protein kinase n=1 Tax=Hyalangium rubrum TaxID=3103134 RepID=A0ABU5HAX4_9BACT|nr:serine/threonine-protein kinase [Hyalangium sp. s54d21]MDY7230024.1 serine/threonine-protein kinase [Hyalangium sp. s54d21]